MVKGALSRGLAPEPQAAKPPSKKRARSPVYVTYSMNRTQSCACCLVTSPTLLGNKLFLVASRLRGLPHSAAFCRASNLHIAFQGHDCRLIIRRSVVRVHAPPPRFPLKDNLQFCDRRSQRFLGARVHGPSARGPRQRHWLRPWAVPSCVDERFSHSAAVCRARPCIWRFRDLALEGGGDVVFVLPTVLH